MTQIKKLATPVDSRDDDSYIDSNTSGNEPVEPAREEEKEEDDAGYDILPSNSSGLVGDDGEEVIDEQEGS